MKVMKHILNIEISIYGDEKKYIIQIAIDSDHAHLDIMCQICLNGNLLEKFGVEKRFDRLMENVLIEVILEMIYYFHLQVAAAAAMRASTIRVATVTIGRLLQVLQMPITPTAYPSIRLALVPRAAAIVLTDSLYVASRIPKVFKP